jgi:hypothetical protein
MTNDPMVIVKGRADAIKRALADAKIQPNTLTAAALCYLAMRLLGLKGPQIDEFLEQGPFGTIRNLLKKLEGVGSETTADAMASEQAPQPMAFDPGDPNATITLTQRELWEMIDQASGGSTKAKH